MDNSIYIILDCVYDLRTRVSHLYCHNFEEIFNRVRHHLDENKIKHLLSEMYNNGYIVFFSNQEEIRLPDKITSSDIDSNLYISLTEKGGELWESIYQPNWELFIGVDSEFPDNYDGTNEIITIHAGSSEALNHLLKKLQVEVEYKEISPLEQLPVWHPVYWKTLYKGCTVTIQSGDDASEVIAQYMENKKWRKN